MLGVPRNSSTKQIKDAYFKLAMQHHPDKNQGVLTQRFREIKEAYDILSNESSRMQYNNSECSNVLKLFKTNLIVIQFKCCDDFEHVSLLIFCKNILISFHSIYLTIPNKLVNYKSKDFKPPSCKYFFLLAFK